MVFGMHPDGFCLRGACGPGPKRGDPKPLAQIGQDFTAGGLYCALVYFA